MPENQTPHFFKVFLQKDVLSPTLVIPRKFARMYGSRLSGSVRLEVPTGDAWEVKLKKEEEEDGEICLREGWGDFVKHYTISHGYFLVFRYEGGSRFHVMVFNLTACEIDYPVKPDQGRKSRPDDKLHLIPAEEDDGSGTDQDVRRCESRGKKRNKERSLRSPRPRPPKKIRIRGSRAANAGSFDGHLNTCLGIYTPASKVARESGALAKASSHKCERPSFMVIVGSTSIRTKGYLYLPAKFLNLDILKKGEAGDITLCDHSQKTWMVGYSYTTRRCIVLRGWRAFALENELRAGNVLVFELIGVTEVTFRVVIFRDDGASRPMEGGVFAENRRKKLIDETISARVKRRRRGVQGEESPVFETVLSWRDTATGSIIVPTRFAAILSRGSSATLKLGQGSWPVELKIHASDSTALRIASGWMRFVRENALQTGDTCVFKLVDEQQSVIEVSICRKQDIQRTTSKRR